MRLRNGKGTEKTGNDEQQKDAVFHEVDLLLFFIT